MTKGERVLAERARTRTRQENGTLNESDGQEMTQRERALLEDRRLSKPPRIQTRKNTSPESHECVDE